MSGELRVDHGSLEAAAADLSSAVRAIGERLDRLDADLRPLHADWTGEAQQAYAVAQAAWTQAMRDMRSLLAQAAVDVAADEAPEYCPTTREELCCFVCEGRTYYRGGFPSCEAVEASCMDDYAGPIPLPPECPDPCCPTAEEACCMCLYDGPMPIPEGCPDPCEPYEPPEQSLYSDTPPIPIDPDD